MSDHTSSADDTHTSTSDNDTSTSDNDTSTSDDGADASVDTTSLESALTDALGVAVTGTAVLADGLNLVVTVATPDDERAFVLRKPQKLRDTCLFNPVRTEFDILQRLQETPVPTQEPVLFCDDDFLLGDSFFVTRFVDGETVPLGSDLPERFRNATSRAAVADQLLQTLSEIHTLDVSRFEDVCIRQPPLAQVECGVERLDECERVTGRELPRLRAVGEWLRENAPDDSRTTLVHGDFRPGNVLFGSAVEPEITAVLDWETAMLGDPLTEVGYLLLRWRDPDDPTPSLADLESEYAEDELDYLRELNEHGLCPFSADPGSPTRRELVARYEELTGFAYEHDRFYRAHAAFMLATVWEDLHRCRVAAGEESGFPPLVDYMTLVAEDIVDGALSLRNR
ncbi:phosphotransferase family protein [Haloarchaeobius sp. TZWWS8]|uniref:phosphotransferase family protein n=1 Tax=Haloarchaeobius sp. TZWWS8 TaxID=3446121 RepID=UPI003EBE8557